MHDELTKVDIEKMQSEIDERKARNAGLREAIRAAKELGDLSENEQTRRVCSSSVNMSHII